MIIVGQKVYCQAVPGLLPPGSGVDKIEPDDGPLMSAAWVRLVIAVGIAFALAGVVAASAGMYIRTFVGSQLAAQNIVTPEDASIPNAPVTGIATALSMADIIQHHAATSSNGLTYAQMGRFAVENGDPAGTNVADEALKDAGGKPVASQARTTQLTAAGLVTSLSLSAMAIGASYGAIALGVGFTVLGIGLPASATPSWG
jgi:hypothetical protein